VASIPPPKRQLAGAEMARLVLGDASASQRPERPAKALGRGMFLMFVLDPSDARLWDREDGVFAR